MPSSRVLLQVGSSSTRPRSCSSWVDRGRAARILPFTTSIPRPCPRQKPACSHQEPPLCLAFLATNRSSDGLSLDLDQDLAVDIAAMEPQLRRLPAPHRSALQCLAPSRVLTGSALAGLPVAPSPCSRDPCLVCVLFDEGRRTLTTRVDCGSSASDRQWALGPASPGHPKPDCCFFGLVSITSCCEDPFDYVRLYSSWTRSSSLRDFSLQVPLNRADDATKLKEELDEDLVLCVVSF